MNLIDLAQADQFKKELPQVRVGNTVKVHMKIIEGEKERIQVFEGIVIAMQGTGVRRSMTVRKVSFGVGVERIFPMHSPSIDKIEIVKAFKVRRAKLYYIRDLKGKAARLKEVKGPESVKKTAKKARAAKKKKEEQ